MLRQISFLFALLIVGGAPALAIAGPVTGPDGVLRYPLGERTPPTLRCKPLFVCDLVLEPASRSSMLPSATPFAGSSRQPRVVASDNATRRTF